jgi:hypothetical protein
MVGAREQLLNLAEADDQVGEHGPRDEMDQLRIRAAGEALAELRQSIRALDQRASDLGLDEIKSTDDLVPLLFAHSVYKSYPDSFVANGQWARLLLWLDTVSTPTMTDIDVTGVADIDEWLIRIEDAGYNIVASSGTTGKNSFFVNDVEDSTFFARVFPNWVGYPARAYAEPRRPIFLFAPRYAPMRYSHGLKISTGFFGRPDAVYTLTEERMKMGEVMRMGQIRRAMADGTAKPSDVAELERISQERVAQGAASLDELAAHVIEHLHEPVYMSGPWAVFWRILEIVHARGVPDGSFHPDSMINVAGGLKGLTLPDDYEDQMDRFLAGTKRFKVYGMSELNNGLPMCEARNYHPFPWMIPWILDESGEHVLEPGADGRVRGRIAIFDASVHGHWGGIVSGDQGTMDFSPTCACGRPGPVFEDSIVRYSELSAGGDDKLTCGGTIESYIRAAVTS